jgi:type IV pilus assembly protein PilB
VASKKNGASHVPDPEKVRDAWSQQYRVPTIDLAAYEIERVALALVPKDVCKRHRAIPVSRVGEALVVAIADPNDRAALDALASLTGLKIEPVLATADEIAAAIAKYYV